MRQMYPNIAKIFNKTKKYAPDYTGVQKHVYISRRKVFWKPTFEKVYKFESETGLVGFLLLMSLKVF